MLLEGFKNIFKVPYQIVNIGQLKSFGESVIDIDLLKAKGLVDKVESPVKLLSGGDIDFKVKITVNAVSASAKSKVEAAGGEVVLI